MLEAHIQIEDELAAKGFKRALGFKAVKEIAYHYSTRTAIVWAVVAFADALFGAPDLISVHFFFLFGLSVAATVYGYFDWNRRISETKGWSFHAKLDEQGVVTGAEQETRRNWNFYKDYKEYEDYLEIEDTHGGITFLPKTPELFEVIEFTKEKIPVRKI